MLATPTPSAVGRTTLLHLDHMNDHKGYTKLLSTWAKQCRLTGVLFLSLHCDPRPRHSWQHPPHPMPKQEKLPGSHLTAAILPVEYHAERSFLSM